MFKQMLDSMGFRQVAADWGLPAPRSNRGDAPLQLVEQFIVSIWCGACRFAHAETVRRDSTLVRLFGWTKAAGHKAILRLFGRFDLLSHERGQAEIYRGCFGKMDALQKVTLDVDSTVIPWNGEQEGAVRGYNANRQGRASHHPLLAFVAEARLVANFWLRPGNAHSANNFLPFLESTLHHLGDKIVGLLRADSGFFDEAILLALEGKRIPYIIAARLTQPLQRRLYQVSGWWALEAGLELAELRYQAGAGRRRGGSLSCVNRSSARRRQARPCRCSRTIRIFRAGAMAPS